MKERQINRAREEERPYRGNIRRRRLCALVGLLAPLAFVSSTIHDRPVAPERTEEIENYQKVSELSQKLDSFDYQENLPGFDSYQDLDRELHDFLEAEKTNPAIATYLANRRQFESEISANNGALVLGGACLLIGPFFGYLYGAVLFGNRYEDKEREKLKEKFGKEDERKYLEK